MLEVSLLLGKKILTSVDTKPKMGIGSDLCTEKGCVCVGPVTFAIYVEEV